MYDRLNLDRNQPDPGMRRLLVDSIMAIRRETERQQLQTARFFDEHPDHVTVLGRIYERTVYRDEFGDLQTDEWNRRLIAYIKDKMGHLGLRPSMGEKGDSSEFLVEAELENRWEGPDATPTAAPEPRTGEDYERDCLEILEAQGFKCELTPATGDQGADIIATDGNHRIAIQCKLRSRPVGNKAVQEAHAGSRFYHCRHAVVATDAGFTPKARQAGSSLGVLLLSTEELRDLREALLI